MLIKDLMNGTVREYGTDHHDSLAISNDGNSLYYYNLQNGDGSGERGNYRFVMEDGEVPKDSTTADARHGESYFNIGGFKSYERGYEDGFTQGKADTRHEWISIRDGGLLPEDGRLVNVVWVNHNPASYYMEIKDKPYMASAIMWKGNWYWYSAYCLDYLKEYDRDEADEVADAIEITHWSPLPELPTC